ncbi:LuxR C-terminal-related transcriptional regulator [Micromonospora sp. BRA006-A]|nr:LuxR C-terminal-related transcriptional regulator [Micromonospora sp. BRA006-A]
MLGLLARGLSNPLIAHRLGLSAKTVRNNVSAILVKLRLGSRAEAIARRATTEWVIRTPPNCRRPRPAERHCRFRFRRPDRFRHGRRRRFPPAVPGDGPGTGRSASWLLTGAAPAAPPRRERAEKDASPRAKKAFLTKVKAHLRWTGTRRGNGGLRPPAPHSVVKVSVILSGGGRV